MIRTTAYQERLDALSTGAEGERLAAEYLLKEGSTAIGGTVAVKSTLSPGATASCTLSK